MDYIRKTWAKVRAVLVSMPPSQRYSIVVLLGVVAVSVAMLVTWGGREEYMPVMSDLNGAQMTSIQNALKDSGIKYKFGDGMLMVQPGDRDKVWMVLSEKGALPSDISKSFGFEDLVKPAGISMETAEQQRMKYNIALGNELARCIASSPEIAKAEVYIASSRDNLFSQEQATASVLIQPRTSEPLPEKKLRAICYLVSAAVGPKLPAKAVRVANLVTGDSYSIDDGESAFSKAANRMELQRTCSREYERQVANFLGATFGPVRILVDPKIDASTRSTTKTAYDAVIEQKSNVSKTTGAVSPGGDSLTQANVGASVTAGNSSGTPSTSETEEKTKKSAPTEYTVTETPPGEIVDIGITVVADLERVESVIRKREKPPEGTAITIAQVEAECRLWEERLKTGLPVNPATKISRVNFSAAPFAKIEMASAAPVTAQVKSGFAGAASSLLANWQRVALAMLAVVALFMIRGVASKAEAEVGVAKTKQPETEEEIPLPEPEADMATKRAAKMRETIEDVIRSDPQAAVSLIRRWMARES